MKLLRDITPDSGSYMSEADRLEPDFKHAFYGGNYPRLLDIKKKYDPHDVFWAATAVGSDSWVLVTQDGLPTENGRLCRVKRPDQPKETRRCIQSEVLRAVQAGNTIEEEEPSVKG
jgi:hypothetical protein